MHWEVLSRWWQGHGRGGEEGCFWGQLSPSQIILGKPQSVTYMMRPKGVYGMHEDSQKSGRKEQGGIRSEWMTIHWRGSQNFEQKRISAFPAKTLKCAYKSIRWSRMPLDSGFWTLGLQLVALFGEVWEVQHWYRKGSTPLRMDFEVKTHAASSLPLLHAHGSSHHACHLLPYCPRLPLRSITV